MKNTNVLLSIGLSLTKLGEKIQVYIKYMMSDSEIDLKFEKERYHVNVARVSVFPQYYATV